MIDWTEITNGDTWELFARDFLANIGFIIDVDPGRGIDAGRDMIVSEQLNGIFTTRKTKWLVSCKHFAHGNRSVGVSDEQNIIERLKQHEAEGFLGFYSTLASSSLIERLRQLKEKGEIKDYEIFDGKKIERRFVDAGLSRLALRYIPENYCCMRPIQQLFGDYQPISCAICSVDILRKSVLETYSSACVFIYNKSNIDICEEIAIVCKGECDALLKRRLELENKVDLGWEDIGDLCNPIQYLKTLISYMNQLHRDKECYSEEAHKQLRELFILIAQRTLRETTVEDNHRFLDLDAIDGL